MRDPDYSRQGTRHSEFRKWAEEELGDRRQVYALRVDAPPGRSLEFMPDDEAHRFREAAKSGALICPVPGCASQKLTTRHYKKKRDHFVHRPTAGGVGHSHHSYRELVAQRLLHEWAEAQDRVVEVLDDKKKDSPVTVLARLDDGSEVALCYVDKRLGADVWEERNRSLRSAGLGTAWIFAPTNTYCEPPEPTGPGAEDGMALILDRLIYERMRWRGSWPLLMSLERRQLASIFIPNGAIAQDLRLAPPDLDRVLHVETYGLAECWLCRDGIATPAVHEDKLKPGRHNWTREHKQGRGPRRS